MSIFQTFVPQYTNVYHLFENISRVRTWVYKPFLTQIRIIPHDMVI